MARFMRTNWSMLRPIIARWSSEEGVGKDHRGFKSCRPWETYIAIGLMRCWADIDPVLATEVFHTLGYNDLCNSVQHVWCITSFLLSSGDRAGCQRMIDAAAYDEMHYDSLVTDIGMMLFDADPLFAATLDWSSVEEVYITACDGCKARKMDAALRLIDASKWLRSVRVQLFARFWYSDGGGRCVHQLQGDPRCPINDTDIEKLIVCLSRGSAPSLASVRFDDGLMIRGKKSIDDLLSMLVRLRDVGEVLLWFRSLDYKPVCEEVDASLYDVCARHGRLLPKLVVLRQRGDVGDGELEPMLSAFRCFNDSRGTHTLLCNR
jgi:hypothetical protein